MVSNNNAGKPRNWTNHLRDYLRTEDWLKMLQENYSALTLEEQLARAPEMFSGDYLRAKVIE
jgi:hypothetical protein